MPKIYGNTDLEGSLIINSGITGSNLFYVNKDQNTIYIGSTYSSFSLSQTNYGLFTTNYNPGYNTLIAHYVEVDGGQYFNVGVFAINKASSNSTQNSIFYAVSDPSNSSDLNNYLFRGELTTGSTGSINFGFHATINSVSYQNTGIYLDVSSATGSNEGMRIGVPEGANNYAIRVDKGNVVFNEDGFDCDFRVEGITESNLLFVDASTDNIGIGSDTPLYKLQVVGTVSSTGILMTGTTPITRFTSSNNSGSISHHSRGDSITNLKQSFTFFQSGFADGVNSSAPKLNMLCADISAYGPYNGFHWYFNNNLNPLDSERAMWLSPKKTLSIFSGTGPDVYTSKSDSFEFYSSDVVAGNASPHFRTENGSIIRLYQETNLVGSATHSVGTGSSLLIDDTFDGYTIQQVVRALRNLGMLA